MGAEIRAYLEGEHTLKVPDAHSPAQLSHRNKGVPVLNGTARAIYMSKSACRSEQAEQTPAELLQELETTAKVDNQPQLRS